MRQIFYMQKEKLIVYGALILSMIFWSFSFVWYQLVFEFYKPITVIILRLSISSVVLITVTLLIGKLQKLKREHVVKMLVLSLFQPFLYFFGESLGMQYVTATTGAVIISIIPLVTPIAAYYFIKERLRLMNYFGLFFSFTGVALVVLENDFTLNAPIQGIMYLLLAVLAAVAYSVYLIKLTNKYNVISIITYQNTIGIFYFLPLFLIFDYEHFISIPITMDLVIPMLELAIFASSFAFILFTYGIQKIGISKANTFSNLIPVFTAIYAYYRLGDELDMQKIVGVFVVMGGLFLSQYNPGVRNGR